MFAPSDAAGVAAACVGRHALVRSVRLWERFEQCLKYIVAIAE